VAAIVDGIRELDDYNQQALRVSNLTLVERESIVGVALASSTEYFNSFQLNPHRSGVEELRMAPLHGDVLPEEGVAPGVHLQVQTTAQRNRCLQMFTAALARIDRTRSGKLVGVASIQNIETSPYHMKVGWTPDGRQLWRKLYCVRHQHLYVPRTGDINNRPLRQLHMAECTIYGDTLPSLIEHVCAWRMVGASIVQLQHLPTYRDSWIVFEGIHNVFVRGNIMDLTRYLEMKDRILAVVADLGGEEILGWGSQELRVAVLNHPIFSQLLPRLNPPHPQTLFESNKKGCINGGTRRLYLDLIGQHDLVIDDLVSVEEVENGAFFAGNPPRNMDDFRASGQYQFMLDFNANQAEEQIIEEGETEEVDEEMREWLRNLPPSVHQARRRLQEINRGRRHRIVNRQRCLNFDAM